MRYAVTMPRHIFILGNSGSGKSTLAERLCSLEGRVHVDLDPYAWTETIGIRRDVSDAAAAIRATVSSDPAVIEGCYADLVEALATQDDHLIWLDVSAEVCTSNCKKRPFEPHKWESAEKQDEFLPRLLEFVGTYKTRTDCLGRNAHRETFERFTGTKERREE